MTGCTSDLSSDFDLCEQDPGNFSYCPPEPFRYSDSEKLIMYLVPSVSGLILNSVILLAVCVSSRIQSRPFLFMISMAVCDLLASLFVGLINLYKHRVFDLHYYVDRLFSAVKVCIFDVYLEQSMYLVLILNLTGVSLERYFVICHPFKARQFWSRYVCFWVILGSWVLSLVLNIVEIAAVKTNSAMDFASMIFINGTGGLEISWANATDAPSSPDRLEDTCITNVNWHGFIVFYRLTVLFFLPFGVMSFCYARVIAVLWRSTNELIADPKRKPTDDGPKDGSSRPRRLVKQSTSLSLRGFGRRTATGLSLASSIISMVTPNSTAAEAGDLQEMEEFATFDSEPNSRKASEARRTEQSTVAAKHRFSRKTTITLELKRTRQKVIRMLIVVMLVFFVCFMPKLLVDVAWIYHHSEEGELTGLCSHVCAMPSCSGGRCCGFRSERGDSGALFTTLRTSFSVLMFSHSTLSPLMYVVFSSEIRGALRQLFCKPTATYVTRARGTATNSGDCTLVRIKRDTSTLSFQNLPPPSTPTGQQGSLPAGSSRHRGSVD